MSATIDPKASSAAGFHVTRMRPWMVILICVVPVLLLVVGYWLFNLPGQPANWRIEKNALVITDARNHEAWRWNSDWRLDPSGFRETNDQVRCIWIGDMDEDGGNETLFAPPPSGEQFYQKTSPLICFDRRGKERWRFLPGSEVSSGRERFANLFHVRNFQVAPLARGQPKSIIVSAIHVPDYPCQISLLDIHTGLPVRQYWHSGYIGHQVPYLSVADLDGNGISEIYLAGINQARYRFTLVVLDPDRFEGGSYEEDPGYQLQGFPPGREIRRVIFPNSCMNPGRSEGLLEGIHFVPDGLMIQILESAQKRANLDYYFSRNGKFLKMSPGDSFRTEHQSAEREGRIDHPFTREEHQAIEKSVIVLPPSYELAASNLRK